MKREEFKQLIKESVKETFFEEGTLSTIIAEVVKGLSSNIVVEKQQKQEQLVVEEPQNNKNKEIQKQKLLETKKRMLDAIGNASYNGADLFEGTKPLNRGGAPDQADLPTSALAGIDPNDSGIDISSFIGKTGAWKKIIK